MLVQPILTPRLRLEPVTRALALAAGEGRAAFSAAIGAVAPPDWCASSLDLVAHSGPAEAPVRAVAIHRGDGEVIADVRFEPPGRAQSHLADIEIGYSVARGRRRQGYAVEATGAVMAALFEAGAETILAGCDKDNLASIRTLRRLGFWLDSTPRRTFWWVLDAQRHLSARA